jgi:hypothetical protein
MVRVHSGLPFQVAISFSTCDSVPVFSFFQRTNHDSGGSARVLSLAFLLRGEGLAVIFWW